MLRVGGRLNVMVPVCGYLDHGFYQFSPTLFYSLDGGFVELETLIFYVNQQRRNSVAMWDGLRDDFRAHRHGAFDGSYRANLMQYLLEPVVSWAVFRKVRAFDRSAFMRDTHQQIYTAKWRTGVAHAGASERVRHYISWMIDTKLPTTIRRAFYLATLHRTRLRPEQIAPLS